MIAKAALIAVAVEGAKGFETAILFVFFQQEGSIVDECLLHTLQK